MAGPIKKCDVRMYRIGTGDCFVLSFKTARGRKPTFKMMIDCGAYQGGKEKFEDHVNDLLDHVDNEVDVLLITHEHQDHVLGFQRCAELFKNRLKINKLWLAWTENEDDEKVQAWKETYGKKKRTLALALEQFDRISTTSEPGPSLFERIYNNGAKGNLALDMRNDFIDTLRVLTHLHVDEPEPEEEPKKVYSGGLKGLEIVKKDLKKGGVRYLIPGETIEGIEGLDNIRIHVLGPPHNWLDVKTEHGRDGETYKHNKELEMVNALSAFDLEEDHEGVADHPFSPHYCYDGDREGVIEQYLVGEKEWRRIDFDWLFTAGELSLRLTRGINNLSVVLAIEFVDSGKVMLFPGDAEFGSWRSWHDIKWETKGKDNKHLTEDLLNRTVFYKVAHHMSHNGTAKEKGLDMMTSPDLVAMGTVDYGVISKNWQNTMPNRGIVKDLLKKTKGKLIIMDTTGIKYDKAGKVPLQEEIDRRLEQLPASVGRSFRSNYDNDPKKLFYDYRVDGS